MQPADNGTQADTTTAPPDRREAIRVAQIGPDPVGPGGMPAALSALLKSPLAARYGFDVIPTYRGSRPLPRLLLFLRSLLALVRWCAGSGRRIVHVHMAARGSVYRKSVVVAVAKAMRRPVVLQVHAGPGDLGAFLDTLGPIRRRALRAALTAPDRLLSVSTSSAEALRPLLDDADIAVVPNAPPSIEPHGPRPQRQQVTVLFLGGFANPVKGGAVLVAALPTLLAACPSARVLLAGPGDGPVDLPDRARWLGWLDPPARDEAFEDADLFVMPSLSEGMPIALLEAMARGLPIVATRTGGMGELLTHGRDAVLVEPGDAVGLAKAIGDLVEDPERRSALGLAAVDRTRRLSDEDVYGALGRIYESVSR